MATFYNPENDALIEHVSITLEWRSAAGDSGSRTLLLGKDDSTLAAKNYLHQATVALMNLAGEKSPDRTAPSRSEKQP